MFMIGFPFVCFTCACYLLYITSLKTGAKLQHYCNTTKQNLKNLSFFCCFVGKSKQNGSDSAVL